MTIWAELKNGQPAPIKIVRGEWVDDGGVTHAAQAFRDPAFRAAYNIAEILPTSYDSKTHFVGDVSGYIDNGNGTWSEDRIVDLRPLEIQVSRKIADLIKKHDQVSGGGMIHDLNEYPTDGEVMNRVGNLAASIGAGRAARSKKIFDINGDLISLNPVKFNAYIKAIGDHAEDCYDNMIAHLEAIKTLEDAQGTTPTDMFGYDISTGWPENPATDFII